MGSPPGIGPASLRQDRWEKVDAATRACPGAGGHGIVATSGPRGRRHFAAAPGRSRSVEVFQPMPEDRAIIVETAAGEKLTFTHLDGFDAVSRCFEFTVGLTGPETGV